MNPKVSICQFKILSDKIYNISRTRDYITEACEIGSDIIVVPECFVCEYNTKEFDKNSEYIEDVICEDSPAVHMLMKCSKAFPEAYIVGGSIIEKVFEETNEKLYNTCLVFNQGEIIAKYRKNNLYKITMKEHSFSEGDVLTAGHQPTFFETKFGNIGLGICYDLRFPDLARYYQENECKIIIYPGSFNKITGPKHWKLLQQARALDNQVFVVSCSSACNKGSAYESYGKSYIISPWANIIKETTLDKEEIVSITINISEIDAINQALPVL